MWAHAHAPVRVEIAGGGTDLPAWTRRQTGNGDGDGGGDDDGASGEGRSHTGLCLSLAIDTYCHAVAITRPDSLAVASYSQLERASRATEIANGLIREAALLHGWMEGFEVHTLSEVPSRGSGLGVSSSLAVCLTSVFSRLAQMKRGVVGDVVDAQMKAACEAWTVEIDRLHAPIGKQDHMAAAWGGLRLYAFWDEDSHDELGARVERTFSYDDACWVAQRLVLVRLPEEHDARAICAGVSDPEVLRPSYDAVSVAVGAIEERRTDALGEAFHQVHETKRAIAGSVTPSVAAVIDVIDTLKGVRGCTVAGAGGGGHVVAVCEPEWRDALISDVRKMLGLLGTKVAPDIYGARSEGWR